MRWQSHGVGRGLDEGRSVGLTGGWWSVVPVLVGNGSAVEFVSVVAAALQNALPSDPRGARSGRTASSLGPPGLPRNPSGPTASPPLPGPPMAPPTPLRRNRGCLPMAPVRGPFDRDHRLRHPSRDPETTSGRHPLHPAPAGRAAPCLHSPSLARNPHTRFASPQASALTPPSPPHRVRKSSCPPNA